MYMRYRPLILHTHWMVGPFRAVSHLGRLVKFLLQYLLNAGSSSILGSLYVTPNCVDIERGLDDWPWMNALYEYVNMVE